MGVPGFGRYRVEGELGRGGMGVVYRGRDPELDREVAIKHIVLPADASRELRDELEKRFRREAKAAAKIRHPGVVAIHDVGTTEDGLYLVMELVDGESLAQRLERGAFPDRASAIEVAVRAADALGAAHRAGVVHRDVKPANILLSNDGRVMLTDFGVARGLDEVSELTRTGMVVGSPAYMAPEQLRGSPVDGRADLFSLGVVLYELLLRKRPFPAQSITTLLYQILHEDPLADPAISRELEPKTAALLRRLLAKQPEDRFADAATTVSALRRLPLEFPGADEVQTPTLALPVHALGAPPVPAVAAAAAPAIVPPPHASAASAETTTYGPSGRTLALLAGGTAVACLIVVGGLLALWNRTPQLPVVQGPRPSGWTPEGGPLPEGSVPPEAPAPTPLAMLVPLPTPADSTAQATPPFAGPLAVATPASPRPTPPPALPAQTPPPAPSTPALPEPTNPPSTPRELPAPQLRCRLGVEFDVNPEEAEVYVDGQRVGTVDELGEYAPPTPGRHLFRFVAPGYKSASVLVEVSPQADDKWVDLELELEEQP